MRDPDFRFTPTSGDGVNASLDVGGLTSGIAGVENDELSLVLAEDIVPTFTATARGFSVSGAFRDASGGRDDTADSELSGFIEVVCG
jgi:hypothetical protein